jgi:predicted nuclease with TOPRIM domain
MGDWINWGIFGSIGVPIIVAALGTWGYIASHKTQKGTRENALIDQMQEMVQSERDARKEEREAESARSDKQDARMEKIEAKVSVLERVSRIRLEYIYVLRRHIDERRDPPAPEWPPGIHD